MRLEKYTYDERPRDYQTSIVFKWRVRIEGLFVWLLVLCSCGVLCAYALVWFGRGKCTFTITNTGESINIQDFELGSSKVSDNFHNGSGLNDALTVFLREGQTVTFRTNLLEFTIHEESGIMTVSPKIIGVARRFRGTSVTFECTPAEMEEAKSQFLAFYIESDDVVSTVDGGNHMHWPANDRARGIFIHGRRHDVNLDESKHTFYGCYNFTVDTVLAPILSNYRSSRDRPSYPAHWFSGLIKRLFSAVRDPGLIGNLQHLLSPEGMVYREMTLKGIASQLITAIRQMRVEFESSENPNPVQNPFPRYFIVATTDQEFSDAKEALSSINGHHEPPEARCMQPKRWQPHETWVVRGNFTTYLLKHNYMIQAQHFLVSGSEVSIEKTHCIFADICTSVVTTLFNLATIRVVPAAIETAAYDASTTTLSLPLTWCEESKLMDIVCWCSQHFAQEFDVLVEHAARVLYQHYKRTQ